MSREYKVNSVDLENLRKLCRTFNSFVPKTKGFIPIPKHLVALEPMNFDDFFMQPELSAVEKEEFPIDILTPTEKNILFIETLMTYNLELLNKNHSEKISNLEEGDNQKAFEANFESNLLKLFSSTLMMIQIILSSNIYLRLAQRGLTMEGSFSVRENFIIASKPLSDFEETPQEKPTHVIIPVEDFEALTGQVSEGDEVPKPPQSIQ